MTDTDAKRKELGTKIEPFFKGVFTPTPGKRWKYDLEKFEVFLDWLELDAYSTLNGTKPDPQLKKQLFAMFDGFSHARRSGRLDPEREAQRMFQLLRALSKLGDRGLKYFDAEEVDV